MTWRTHSCNSGHHQLSSVDVGLLLLPLLQVLQVPGAAASDHAVSRLARQWFDGVGLSRTLPSILLVYLALASSYLLLIRWKDVLSARVEQDFLEALRNEFFEAVSRASWLFLVGQRRADFVHALTADLRRIGDGTVFVLRLFNAATVVVTYLLVGIVVSPILAALTAAGAAAMTVPLRRQYRRVRTAGERAAQLHRAFFTNAAEHLAGIKEARSFCAEPRHIKAFEQLTTEMKTVDLDYVRAHANSTLIHSLGTLLLLCATLYLAVGWFAVTLPEQVVVVLVFSRLVPWLHELHSSFQRLVHMLPAFTSARQLRLECEQVREPPPCHAARPALQTALTLTGVGFRYEPRGRWILRDVNLTIPAGTTTAVVGASGSGKSTLADLLMGLLSPDTGEIEVDGQPLAGPELGAWRQQTGYVPQETFLLHDSIAANLRWANPAAGEADLWKALELAAAADFVRSLPRGLETVTGDRGVCLSGGQRQRIALARAFVRRPALLILDEATNALDAENENRIREIIEQLHGKLTILMIAHGLATVRSADQIVVLEGGQIVERGTYPELTKRAAGRLGTLLHGDGDPLFPASIFTRAA
ncbi:MAG: ABC transporter ATP-binding protein [Planctomycetota bacterium]|nr:ABC transporter ATP-binding protein [Planctomycetota bacterium]